MVTVHQVGEGKFTARCTCRFIAQAVDTTGEAFDDAVKHAWPDHAIVEGVVRGAAA